MNYRIMGIDYGLKKIGVALSDTMGIIASPFSTIENTNSQASIKEILKLVAENNVGEIAVGMPLNMDGSESSMSCAVREFIKRLKENSALPVVEIDERLTTSQTDRMLIEEADISRAERKKARDKIAASLILRVYLERKCIS
ncbi:MAG: Holliday junction resolvase RuvX [Elusimicrobiota bacterium]|jgi:putative Holliday junction resolvase|nr:Holliday junction resolvase RuvX [Elusimicrobiota bacterium]